MVYIIIRNVLLAIFLCGLLWKISSYVALRISKLVNPQQRQAIYTLASVLLAVILLFGFFSVYVNWGFGYQGDIVRKVETNQKIVAFTFDDGPSPEYTPQILDILAEHQVNATFFLVGQHIEKYPHVVEGIQAAGHYIGNHTFTHKNIPTAPASALSSELFLTNLEIMKVTGDYPLYIRPPRGMYDQRFRRLADLLGMQIVLWSLSSQDWLPTMTAESVQRRVLQRVKPGDIILFHDSGAIVRSEGASRLRTVSALPGIITGLKEMGYQIVPLPTLLDQELAVVVDEGERWPEY